MLRRREELLPTAAHSTRIRCLEVIDHGGALGEGPVARLQLFGELGHLLTQPAALVISRRHAATSRCTCRTCRAAASLAACAAPTATARARSRQSAGWVSTPTSRRRRPHHPGIDSRRWLSEDSRDEGRGGRRLIRSHHWRRGRWGGGGGVVVCAEGTA